MEIVVNAFFDIKTMPSVPLRHLRKPSFGISHVAPLVLRKKKKL